MATLQEIHELFRNREMLDRTEAALTIAAYTKLQGTPNDPAKQYAAFVYGNPEGEARKALKSVLAANSGATVEQITGASDGSLQNNVNMVYDSLEVAYVASLSTVPA